MTPMRALDHPDCERFLKALNDGVLELGQTLTQQDLADALGLSLSPAREMIALLEAEGLVSVRRRIGVVIFAPDVKYVGAMFQVREMLEVEGLARFVAVPRQDWCAAMRTAHAALIEKIRPATDPKSFEEEVRTLELAFHGSFVDAYRNPVVAEIYRNIHKKMFLFRLIRRTAVNVENTIKAMEEHLALIDAIAAGDGAAARRALETHVRGVLHRVVYG